jgi:hypothetical protein
LAQARVLLWAREGHHAAPREAFEVSKVVDQLLQPKCQTAPSCPSSAGSPFQAQPTWIDPDEPPAGDCAYGFRLRGQCLLHRNRRALEAALFQIGEAARARRWLQSLGYLVHEEVVDPLDGAGEARILSAHSNLGEGDEVRVVPAPGGGRLVLVRPRSDPSSSNRDERLSSRCQTT